MSKVIKNLSDDNQKLFGSSALNLKKINSGIGILFVIMTLIGFWGIDLWGLHLQGFHTFIHLLTGLLALWFSSLISFKPVYVFSITVGLIYLLLSIGGFLLGEPQNNLTNDFGADPFHWHLSPFFMLGKTDHIFHAVVATVLLISANTHANRKILPVGKKS